MKNLTLVFILCILNAYFFSHHASATSYSWTGTTSTAWGTSTNWSPNGVPAAGDNVTITSQTNQPVYNGVAGITNIVMSSGTLNLGGYTLNASGTGTFTGGTITNGKLVVTSTGNINFSGTVFNCRLTVTGPGIFFNGSTFNDTTRVTRLGGTGVYSCSGGNKFYGYTVLTSKSTAQLYMCNGTPFTPDTCWNTFIVNMDSTGTVALGYGNNAAPSVFYGKVYVNKKAASPANDLFFGYNGKVEFHDSIFVNNVSSRHVYFGNNATSSVVLKNNATIALGASGFTGGTLYFKYLDKQNSNKNINLSLGTSAGISIGPSCSFNGTFTFSGGYFYLNGSTFHNIAAFTKTGTGNNVSSGGNVFNSNITFTNQTASSITLANTTGDDFNGDATFVTNSSGAIIPAYNKVNTFAGNITATGGSLLHFGSGASANMSILDGGLTQTISGTVTTIRFKKLTLNKSGYSAIISHNINVTDSLKFVNGLLETSTYVVELNDNCKATGATDASYVSGIVKKTGNDAFTFPVGKNGQYRSIAMSAPASATDAYTAQYFWANSNSTYSHSSKDAAIAELSRAEYWKLDRNTGTSNVTVTLSWENSTSCGFSNTANLKVAAWDGTTWKDKGNGGTTGTTTAGTIVTSAASTTYGAYSLGTTATFDCFCWDATSMTSGNSCMNGHTLATAERWYKFTADSSRVDIKVRNVSSSPVIQFLEIYTSCDGGYLLGRDTITLGSGDTVMTCTVRNLTIGGTYYAKLIRSASGTATYNICKTYRNPNVFNQLYPGVGDPASACGLKYAQRSVKMNERIRGTTVGSPNPPITFDFTTSAIPANAVLEKVYLWFSATGTHNGASRYIPDANIPYNIQTSNQNVACLTAGGIARTAPLLAQSNINNNADDNATCWGGYTEYANMQITCTYFDDLTTHFITNNFMEGLNQRYTISNLPAVNNSFDITGATLMILYREPCTGSTNPSRIVIQHGIDVIRQQTFFGIESWALNGLGAFSQNANAHAFMLVEDLENNTTTYDMINPPGPPFNFNAFNPVDGIMHNFIDASTSDGTLNNFTSNQASLVFRIDRNTVNDCYAVTMMGAYMENADVAATCTPIGIDIVPTDNCSPDAFALNSTLTGGAATVLYAWRPAASITGSTTTQNTTGNAPTPVNYSVTATGGDGCRDVDYTVVAHCYSANQNYNICGAPPGGNNTSTAFLNQVGNPAGDIVVPPPFNTGILYINSLFTVDHDIVLENWGQILLSPNARIVVNPGFTLTLKACTLTVCENYMWDGIYLSTSGANVSKLIAGGTQFEDAINAVVSDNGGNYDISNSRFVDCHIGIRVQNYNPVSSAAHPGKVVNTTFIQSGTLIPPHCGERFFAGIDVYLVDDLTIGSNSSTVNTFNTLRYGVRAERSDVTLYNNTFTNVGNVGSPPLSSSVIPDEGAVVTWSAATSANNPIDSKILVLGNGSTVHNTFTNCNFGVYARWHFASVINGNAFTNVDNGVWLVNSKNATVAGPASSSGNTFSNSDIGTAVRVENVWLLWGNSGESVYSNTISGHQTGIFTTHTKGARIQSNGITFTASTQPYRGIRAESTNKLIIHSNTVSHGTTPTVLVAGTRYGILSTLNTAPTISTNSLTKMGSGIVAQGNNNNSILVCNHNTTCYHGFNFLLNSPATVIGTQVWLPPSGLTTPYAFRRTDNDWTTMVAGGFRVRGGVLPLGTQWGWTGPANGAFDPSPNSVTGISFSQPGASTPCPYTPASPPVDTTQRRVLFQQIVLDTANLGDYEDGLRYYQQEYAYRTFRETPSWLTLTAGSNAPYSDFYNTLHASNLEKFILAEDTVLDGEIAYATTLLNSITPANIFEENRKTVDAIFLNTWALDMYKLSEADSLTLREIAYLHALTNGPGVYTARVMLGLNIEDTYEPSSKTDETSFSQEEDQLLQFTKIYPNPNSGTMQMDYVLPEGTNGVLEVLDFNGRQIQVHSMYEGLHTLSINLAEYGSGMYFARLFVDGEYQYSEKIVLME